jgi:exopolysaccharide biosynthesis polyprenyl glycosylphosphotransferase
VPVACLAGVTLPTLLALDSIGPAAAALTLWAAALLVQPTANTSAVRLTVGRPTEASALVFAVVAAAAAVGVFSTDVLAPILVALLTASATMTALNIAYRLRHPTSRALLVGDPTAVAAQSVVWSERPGVEVVACEARRAGMAATAEPIDLLASTVEELDVDTVIVCPGPGYSAADLQRLSWELERTPATIIVGGIVDCAPHRLAAGTFAGMPVVAVGPSRRSWLQLRIKSTADRIVAAALLMLVAPLLAMLCLAIRLESPGPALFKQRRVGHGGQPFVMYKLRTMQAEVPGVVIPLQRTAGNEVLFKMKDDPRVTRLGRVLRRFSLDELPQLVNVVRGEMSLIGPRPALHEETKKYDTRAWRRTAVKPGITGLWQVSGRSDLSWDKSVALDVHYVDNWRLTDDLAIAARTFWAVLGKKGAY